MRMEGEAAEPLSARLFSGHGEVIVPCTVLRPAQARITQDVLKIERCAQRRQYILRSAVCCVGYMAAMHVIDARSRYELPSPSVEQCHAGHASLRARARGKPPCCCYGWIGRWKDHSSRLSRPAREPHSYRAKSQRQRRYGAREVAYHCTAKQNKLGITFPVQALRSASLPFFSFGWHPARKGESEAGTKDTTNGEPILQSTSLD